MSICAALTARLGEVYIRQFVEEDGGYAYIGVNLRGTGCSEGTFDFFQPQAVAMQEQVTQRPVDGLRRSRCS